jgi:hypothetical protein
VFLLCSGMVFWLGRGWFLEFQDEWYKLKKGLLKVVGRCIRKEKLAVDVYLNTLLEVYNRTCIDTLITVPVALFGFLVQIV